MDDRDRGWPLLIFLSVFAGYAATAARDFVVGDTAEFLTAVLTFGVPHPSGYPLLTLLGRAFTWLPAGDLPFRANLVAVTSGAGAATFVFLTSRRLGAAPVASAIGSLTLACHPLFWEWSLALEAFPLNNLLAAATVYFLVCWEAEPDRAGPLLLATLCWGLGLSNHLTIVCLMPAAAIVLWRHRLSIVARPGRLLAMAACIVVGVLPYVYLPWAASHHPYLNWGAVSSLGDLVAHFLRSDYGTLNLAPAGGAAGSAWERMAALVASFTWIEAVLVTLGLLAAYRRARWYVWSAILTFALAGPGFAAMANVDPTRPAVLWVLRRFFLLPHVTVAPFAALGFAALSQTVQGLTRRRRVASTLVALSAIVILLVGAVRNGRALDQRQNHLAREFAEDILGSLEPRAILLASGEGVVFSLAYLQAVEHRRPDVTVVGLGLFERFEWYLSELRRRDPTLHLPFARYQPGQPSSGLRALVEANAGRPVAFVGEPQDDGSLRASWFFHRGLVSQIESGERDIGSDAIIAENERLLRGYRVPDAAAIKRPSYEASILDRYARVAMHIGDQYALTYRNAEASAWYRRALAIDPSLAEARTALAKTTGGVPGS